MGQVAHATIRPARPIRLLTSALSTGAIVVLLIFAVALCVCGVVAVTALAAGWKKPLGAAFIGLIVCVAFGAAPAMPALVVAYPTTYFAPTVPYNAAAVDRGTAIYAQNCAVCHGADGKGDGPAAAGLSIKPANLVQPHLFAHTPGDMFWWVGHGYGGVMPPFKATLTPAERWDVIHFVRARAAGIIANDMGPAVSATAAAQVPDFAFSRAAACRTRSARCSPRARRCWCCSDRKRRSRGFGNWARRNSSRLPPDCR